MRRMSVLPLASNTHTPDGIGIIRSPTRSLNCHGGAPGRLTRGRKFIVFKMRLFRQDIVP